MFQSTSMAWHYSGTSVKGPSEKGTTSLQRTHSISPTVYFYWTYYIFNFRKEEASLQETKQLAPKCPFIGGSSDGTCIRFTTNNYYYLSLF